MSDDEKLPEFAVEEPLVPPPPLDEPVALPCHMRVQRDVTPWRSYSRPATLADLRAVLSALPSEQRAIMFAELHPNLLLVGRGYTNSLEQRIDAQVKRAEAAEAERDQLKAERDAAVRERDDAQGVAKAHAVTSYDLRLQFDDLNCHQCEIVAENEALREELDDARARIEKLERELVASKATTDRWQTGTQIEGDFVRVSGEVVQDPQRAAERWREHCKAAQASEARLRERIEQMERVAEAARAWRKADRDITTPPGGTLLDTLADAVDALDPSPAPSTKTDSDKSPPRASAGVMGSTPELHRLIPDGAGDTGSNPVRGRRSQAADSTRAEDTFEPSPKAEGPHGECLVAVAKAAVVAKGMVAGPAFEAMHALGCALMNAVHAAAKVDKP